MNTDIRAAGTFSGEPIASRSRGLCPAVTTI